MCKRNMHFPLIIAKFHSYTTILINLELNTPLRKWITKGPVKARAIDAAAWGAKEMVATEWLVT